MIVKLGKISGSLIPVLIFLTLFYSGCTTGGNIETVDYKTLKADQDDIEYILSFKLKDGTSFYDNDKYGFIHLELWDITDPRIIYSGPDMSLDSIARSKAPNITKDFPLVNVTKAKVLYEKDNSLKYVLGACVGAALIAFLFWANGERNKRN